MTQRSKHVFLIGGRASGKTSLARLLAARLERSWVDIDALIQEETGTIADFVARNGWDAFRRQETVALAGVCARPAMVVACGGGIVLREENRLLLRQGMVIYLNVTPDVLAARLAGDPNDAQRPSLTGKDIREEMREVMLEREPLYQQCADVVIDAALPLEQVAALAAEAVRTFFARSEG